MLLRTLQVELSTSQERAKKAVEEAKRLAFLAEFEDEEETPPAVQATDWAVVTGHANDHSDENKINKKHKNKGFVKNCGLCEKPYNTNAMPNKVTDTPLAHLHTFSYPLTHPLTDPFTRTIIHPLTHPYYSIIIVP